MKTPSKIIIAAFLLAGCAGEETAEKQAARAAQLVTDLKQHNEQTVEAYQFDRGQEYRRVNEFLMTKAGIGASVRTHRAAWQSAKNEDAEALFKANADLADLDTIRQSVPFIAVTPPPAFNSPKLNSDQLTKLATRFTKLASGVAPKDRLDFLLELFSKAGKAYKDANAGAAAGNKALVSAPAAATAAANKKNDDAAEKAQTAAEDSTGTATVLENTETSDGLLRDKALMFGKVESVETNAPFFSE
jgi:hypothetical protein